MNIKAQITAQETKDTSGESGQTIVLIVFMIVGILAFAGIAADVGFLFARSSQFSSAVDAAALAGVVELHVGGVEGAIQRANEFLDANGWPVANTISFTGTETFTDLGLPEFNYTVTWPVETFFMGILGFDEIPVTSSASAAYYSFIDLPTPAMYDRGMIRMGTQFVNGPNSCTAQADPISSPFADASEGNDYYTINDGIYEYRIVIPDDYITDTGTSQVVIQLFDPDSINLYASNTDVITNSNPDIFELPTTTVTCNNTLGVGDTCVAKTGEPENGNPLWLMRVDETWTSARCPERDHTNPLGNTVTDFTLYYRDPNADDRPVELAYFQSNGDNAVNTDMKWVTPDNVGIQRGSFRVDLNSVPLNENRDYVIYLEAKSVAGTSKNAWDIWAAPPVLADDPNLPDNVNYRNVYILQNYGAFDPRDIRIFAQGHLPITVYREGRVKVPVAAIEARQGGGTVYASVFDFDGSARDPFYFLFDTLSPGDFRVDRAAVCDGSTDCNNKWVKPQYRFGIPTNETVAFYGGYLLAEYEPGSDEHVWSIRTTSGRAFLTR